MPIRPITSQPQPRAQTNPPPRTRPAATNQPRETDKSPPASSSVSSSAGDPAKAKKAKRQPTGGYTQGYCLPPEWPRFKEGNPGGPGRPKGRRSQNTLLRTELLKKRTVRQDGRPVRLSNVELLNMLLVKTVIEKSDVKSMLSLAAEARQLLPDPVVRETVPDHDDSVGMQVVREFMAMVTLGDAVPGADVFADIATDANSPKRSPEALVWTDNDVDAPGAETTDED